MGTTDGLSRQLAGKHRKGWVGTYLGNRWADIDDTELGTLDKVSGSHAVYAASGCLTRSTLSPSGTVFVTTSAERTLLFSVSMAFPDRMP